MIKQVITCDVCSKEKGDGNHWMVIVPNSKEGIIFYPWENLVDHGATGREKHICGQECAHKILSQWMETQCKQS